MTTTNAPGADMAAGIPDPITGLLCFLRQTRIPAENRRGFLLAVDVAADLVLLRSRVQRLQRLGISPHAAALFEARWDAIDGAMRAAIWETTNPGEGDGEGVAA